MLTNRGRYKKEGNEIFPVKESEVVSNAPFSNPSKLGTKQLLPNDDSLICVQDDNRITITVNPNKLEEEIIGSSVNCNVTRGSIVSFEQLSDRSYIITLDKEHPKHIIEFTYKTKEGRSNAQLEEFGFDEANIAVFSIFAPDYTGDWLRIFSNDMSQSTRVQRDIIYPICTVGNNILFANRISSSTTDKGITFLDKTTLRYSGSWSFPSATDATYPTVWADWLKIGVGNATRIGNYLYWQGDWNVGTNERYMYKFDVATKAIVAKVAFSGYVYVYKSNELLPVTTNDGTYIYTTTSFSATRNDQHEVTVFSAADLSVVNTMRLYDYMVYHALEYFNGYLFAIVYVYIDSVWRSRLLKIDPTTLTESCYYELLSPVTTVTDFIQYSGGYIFCGYRSGGVYKIGKFDFTDLSLLGTIDSDAENEYAVFAYENVVVSGVYLFLKTKMMIQEDTDYLYWTGGTSDYVYGRLYKIDPETFTVVQTFTYVYDSWIYSHGIVYSIE